MRQATLKTLASAAFVALASASPAAWAHCDTLDGPVVSSARKALDTGKVNPALGWVRAADEGEVRTAFTKAMEVRKGGPAAKELADRYFFETLVRVHRAGEGAGFDGLKPAGTTHPAVAAADKALAAGKLEPVDAFLSKAIHGGLERSFHEAVEAREAAARTPNDVAAGRKAASAYVEYVHFVERLSDATEAKHHAPAGEAAAHSH